MSISTLAARARKALRMPPRYVLGRVRDELRQEARRPWSRVYPRVLPDRAILGESGATSLSDLWDGQLDAPFFVRPVDRERVVAAHASRFPDSRRAIVTAADAFVRHEFDLLGSGPTRLGEQLPWLDDFKTGRHYPLQYCRDIQYMELDKPTDVKVPWELSRCQHFTTLGQAYWLTGDERYAREYVAEITDWIARNPWARSVNWACAMDVALRAISWIWGFGFMGASSACADPAFRAACLRSLYMHGEFVFTHLEKSDVNGNHYLSDGAGLVFLGLFFKHTPRGRVWLDAGKRIVLDEMLSQVTEDGVDFEQSTAYHRLVLELFFTSYLLLERHGEPIPPPQLDRLSRMVEFVAAYTKPNGLAPLVGDADDGRVQKLGQQPLNDHRYLVSTAAVRFGRSDFKQAAGECAEESFWLLGADAADRFDALPAADRPAASVAFPLGGFYIVRGAGTHLVVDCGEVGMRGRGGHGHNDILSFELFMNGMNVVSDCGAYLYTASREWRNRFRSTSFHNVVQVDDEELNRFIGPDALWQLCDDARPRDVRFEQCDGGTRFAGAHTGYERLSPPVRVQREILTDASRPRVVVRDRIDGEGTHRLRWRFHLDPAVTPEAVDGDFRLRGRGNDVWLRFGADVSASARLEAGWISPSYGVRHATQVLVLERSMELPASLVCVFADRRPTADDLCVKF